MAVAQLVEVRSSNPVIDIFYVIEKTTLRKLDAGTGLNFKTQMQTDK